MNCFRLFRNGCAAFILLLICQCKLTGAEFQISHVEASQNPTTDTPHAAVSPLVWDALEKNAVLPMMTNIAYFTFWVTNTAAEEVVIYSTESACECTVAEASKLLPWHIAPGQGGALNVRLNTRGKFGVDVKTITVASSHGTQVLTIRAKIPLTPAPANISPRKQHLLVAQADRQATLRGNCAECHVTPAVGLMGEPLFAKACAICHEAEYRAEMVRDLAALKVHTDANYWRKWIVEGKAGSLMPSFAKPAGGFLETNQIASLVDFLMTHYPERNQNSK